MRRFLTTLAVVGMLGGCSEPESHQSASHTANNQQKTLKTDAIEQTAGYKLILAESDGHISANTPSVTQANGQLRRIHELTSIDELRIADMAYGGAKAIREQANCSALDVLDMLVAVLPERASDLAAPTINKANLIATTIAQYGSMRTSGMSHAEAKAGFVALIKDIEKLQK